jgi:hypothetical protein
MVEAAQQLCLFNAAQALALYAGQRMAKSLVAPRSLQVQEHLANAPGAGHAIS